ncbi:hypothetical protein GOV11_04890 [Candidatus Woesearchaeota archaeon]|nr:hypothetical protein [Candidatus Woesearchaeota archaeon]
MVNQQLLEYISNQEHTGYSEQQIRAALLKSGYSPKDIDAGFRANKPGKHNDVVHDYVQQYARMGYTAPQILSTLIGQGHGHHSVKRAIKDIFGDGAFGSNVPHTHIFMFSIMALVVGAGLMYFVIMFLGSPNGDTPTGVPIITYEPQAIITDVVETARQQGVDAGISGCKERLSGQYQDQCLHALAIMKEVQDSRICGMIETAEVHDSCLMNFLNDDFDSVCDQVKLARSQETCSSLRALRG